MQGVQCQNCKNYIDNLICTAFIDGIPEKILTGETDHTKTLPNQDNDFVFEPISE